MNFPSVQLSSPQHQTTWADKQWAFCSYLWVVCRQYHHTVIILTDTTYLSSLRRSAFSLTWLAESLPLLITWSGWRAPTKVRQHMYFLHSHFFLSFFCPFHCSFWGYLTHCCSIWSPDSLPIMASDPWHQQGSSLLTTAAYWIFFLFVDISSRSAATPTTMFKVTSLYVLWFSCSDFSFPTCTRYAKRSKLHFSLSHGENKNISE